MTTQVTDLNPAREGVAPRDVLVAVADHLTQTDPAAELDQLALIVCLGAETAALLGGEYDREARVLAAEAAELFPEIEAGQTRGEYALILRREAKNAGDGWGEDDNAPVIPRLPRPRTEPVPADRPSIPVQPSEGER
ncbi:hypothetical protein ACH4Q7_22535 [Streptomyces roseolus]|uniref:hypothetical protein n=1 Tax=Streptomyces roseolus TaxID=67358 RepID=UPI00378A1F4B